MGEHPPEHKSFIRLKNQSGTEDVHYSLLYEGFPDEFQEMANRELRETPKLRAEGLKRLREYVKSQKIPALKDDIVLLAALRNCKYDVKKAESKLKKLASFREDAVRQLRKIGLETAEQILDDSPLGILPYRDKLGRVIIYTRPSAVRLDLYTIPDITVVGKSVLLFLLSFPISTVSGYAYFGDCTSPSLQLLYPIFKELRWAIDIVLSLPVRFARAEILNENSLCRWFFRLVKGVLSKKIISRVTLHGTSFEQLHEMYNPGILPEEFGGTAGPISSKIYKQKILDFMRDLLEQDR